MKKWQKRLLIVTGVVLLAGGLYLLAKDGQKYKASQQRLRDEPKVTQPIQEKETWKFGVMADIHADWVEMKKALEKAKSKGLTFMLVAGDLTTVGKDEELAKAKQVLDEAGMEYRVVPGNHDWWLSNKIGKNIFGSLFGKNYMSFSEANIKFIMVDNGNYKGLGEEQKKWLEGEVMGCLMIKCIAVMHMPIEHNFSEHVMGEDSKKVTVEAKWLGELLRKYGVKDLIAGHLHYYSSYEIEGLKTYLVGAVTKERNNQTPRFMEMTVAAAGELEANKVLLEEEE